MRIVHVFLAALLSLLLVSPAAAQSAYDIGMRQKEAKRYDEARITFRSACDAGSQKACAQLAELYEHGRGGKKDLAAAKRLFEGACEAEVGKGCADRGSIFMKADDFAAAAPLLQKGCDLGSTRGCSNLGFIYEKGNLGEPDFAKAARLYERSCDLGSGVGCNNRAVMIRDGLGQSADKSQAFRLFEANCEKRKNGNSCFNAGTLLATGMYDRKLEYFGIACDSGLAEGCRHLGRTYNNRIQRGTTMAQLERDRDLGNRFFDKACNMGSQRACRSEAKILERDRVRVAGAAAKQRVINFRVGNHGCDFSSYQMDRTSQASVDRSIRIQKENERCVKRFHAREVERLNAIVAEGGGYVRFEDRYRYVAPRSCGCTTELTAAVKRIKDEDARLWAKIRRRADAHNRIMRQ